MSTPVPANEIPGTPVPANEIPSGKPATGGRFVPDEPTMMAMGKFLGVILGPSILLMGGLVVVGLAIRSARKRIVEKTESSPSPAPQFNGWQRLGLVSSILWIIISSGIFISVAIINDDYDIITKDIFIFFFLIYSPVVALWILGYAVAWIREGFRKSSS